MPEWVFDPISRRRFLDDGTRRCAMLIEESVLKNRIFGDDVLSEQLHHLLTGMRQPNLSLGIIPLAGRRVQKLTETFHIYGDTTVSIGLVSAIITITQPREIALYVKCFSDLASSAVYGDKARVLITAAINVLEQA